MVLDEKLFHRLAKMRGLPRYAYERLCATLYLRQCGRIGRAARSEGRPHIENAGSICIGDGFRVKNVFVPAMLQCSRGARITIGDRVGLNYGVMIAAERGIKIGNDVLIGNLSIIADTNFPARPGKLPVADDEPVPIEIGDGAWIAARVTILPGANIGPGSVIGAGSVVAGNIPAGVVAIGNPARVVLRLKSEQRFVASPLRPSLASGSDESDCRDKSLLPAESD